VSRIAVITGAGRASVAPATADVGMTIRARQREIPVLLLEEADMASPGSQGE
jgi:hypothetical protein